PSRSRTTSSAAKKRPRESARRTKGVGLRQEMSPPFRDARDHLCFQTSSSESDPSPRPFCSVLTQAPGRTPFCSVPTQAPDPKPHAPLDTGQCEIRLAEATL